MSLLDPKWKYTHSTATDIRKTFAKARKALAKQEQANARPRKLQLCAASETNNSPAGTPRLKSPLYGTRSMPADGPREALTEERSTFLSTPSERRIGRIA